MNRLIFQIVFLSAFSSLALAATNIILTDGGSATDSSGGQISCVGSKLTFCYCEYYSEKFPYTLKISRANNSGTTTLSPSQSKAGCLAELAARIDCK